ncbi:MAG: toprim domain-containing protein, partial [Thermoflexibacter sp.]|nr:toprim domain-containing protein [Thermoflexibacter sp.]
MEHTIVKAKQVQIIDYLASLGHTPQSQTSKEWFYYSPFRNEKTASFAVNPEKNVFNDFGDDKGDIIRLVMKLHHCPFKEAIHLLLQFQDSNGRHSATSFSFSGQSRLESNESKPTILKIQSLQNQALVSYLEGRKVYPIASKYCKEVYYSIAGKNYFSVAFPNDLGGYELRNAYTKNCLSPKSITTIQGTAQNKKVVNIFEGFIDFLSSLVYFKTSKPQSDTIILNSLTHVEQALSKLREYEVVSLFLDNDKAGKAAVETIKQAHSAVMDRAKIYEGYKDFNE